MATLQNLIGELEIINHEIYNCIKAGMLNRSLPENLWFINVFQPKNNWVQLYKYVKKKKNEISDIVFLSLKEKIQLEESNKKLFHIQIKLRRND